MPIGPIRILVVEDDPVQQLSVGSQLRSLGYGLAGIAASAAEALQRFAEEQPDLVLLDVNLTGPRDGIDLAHDLVQRRPVPLIFLTAYPDQATFERARRVGPFAFLGKPFNAPLLGHSIELALQHFASALGLAPDDPGAAVADGAVLLGGVFVREGARLLKVPFAELLVVEADDTYLHLHTPQRKYTVRTSLRLLAEKLPAPQFVRIHRSFIVQAACITACHYDRVFLQELELPLGRTYREQLLGSLPQLP